MVIGDRWRLDRPAAAPVPWGGQGLKQSDIDAIRHRPIPDPLLWIDGQPEPARGRAVIPSVSPIDGRRLAHLAAATADDVDAAVTAARGSFESGRWSRMAPARRKAILHRIADFLERDAFDLAVLGVRDNGTEVGMALRAEPGSAAGTFRYYAECVDKIAGEIAPTDPAVLGLVHREPAGVIGAILPWNFPLMIGAWKIAPALATGNSVVVKPAAIASLTVLRLAELCREAGLPDGVLNVVTGSGSVAGEALARHMDVDVLTFTGSGTTGRALLRASADSNGKPVWLELGGKSPNIIFADAPDLDLAINAAAGAIFRNAGQVCIAGSRLLVEAGIHDRVLTGVTEAAAAMTTGDPLDLKSDIGAVASETQLESILRHVRTARDQGAELVAGGRRILEASGGTYMQPTIFSGVAPDMALFREEVFGPVLAVTPFETEEEAISIANSTEYGLAAGVWTGDLGRAHRMVRAIDSGVVFVNTYGGADITMPLAGHRQSGSGADKSLHALDKFTRLKSAWIRL